MALKQIFRNVLIKNEITNYFKCQTLSATRNFTSIEGAGIKNVKCKGFVSRGPMLPPRQVLFEDTSEEIVELTEEEVFGSKLSDGKDENGRLKYQKIDGNSHILTSFMVNVKSRRKREKSGQIILEGKRLIQDALDVGVKPLSIFFSRPSDVKGLNLDEGVPLYRVPYKNLQFWSEVATSQGVVGIFPMPNTAEYDMPAKLPLTIICDNVRDPGNLGSVLRTAAAVGCKQLILTQGCVDLWEPKVLRTAAGAHFRTNIRQALSWSDVQEVIPPNASIFLADSNIPPPAEDISDVDVYELDERGEKVPVLAEAPKRITAYQKHHETTNLPLLQYTKADFTSGPVVLVIGGETHGLCAEARYWAQARGGYRVFVPLDNGVESLNSGTALGILAYEIRRQVIK